MLLHVALEQIPSADVSLLIIFLLLLITYHLSLMCVLDLIKQIFSYPRTGELNLRISHPTHQFKTPALRRNSTTSLFTGNLFLQPYTF
jgi:hypothetical protein